MKTAVIFGAGQVAQALVQATAPPGWTLRNVARAMADITDAGAVAHAIEAGPSDAVINAAAYNDVEAAEDDVAAAFAVNRDGPGHIAAVCAARDVALVHFSSDYVFGDAGARAWCEDDTPAPINQYGASKLAGEEAVRAATSRHVIIRTAWIYADRGDNFVATMLALARTRDDICVVDDQIGNPTAAADIAGAVWKIVAGTGAAGDNFAFGTYHYAGAPVCSWYAHARAIFEVAAAQGLKVPRVRPITSAEYPLRAARPANSSLDCSLIARRLGIAQPDWRDALGTAIEALAGGDVGQ